MKNSWRQIFRRLATGCAVAAATSWSSAICYATLAFDSADDPVYANGWQGREVDAAGVAVVPTGDNGGFGFTQWDFTSVLTFGGYRYDYANPEFHAIDDGLQAGTHYSNPFNNIGRSWALGISPTNAGVPRAGRGFSLAIGETLKVVVDNPTTRQFFKGYQINLNGGTGGVNGNICYGGVECVAGSGAVRKTSLNTFEFMMSNGQWKLNDAANTNTGLIDTQTAAAGAVFTVERTGTETYIAKFDSLGAGTDFGPQSRTFSSPGKEVDWIEFTFFNTPTDTGTPPTTATDLYIRSMEIIGSAPPGQPGDFNNDGTVNTADYVAFRKLNGTNTPLPNDNGLGTPIRPAHYDLFRQNFGEGGAGFGGAVPEPATLVLFVAAFGIGLAFPRSRRDNRDAKQEKRIP